MSKVYKYRYYMMVAKDTPYLYSAWRDALPQDAGLYYGLNEGEERHTTDAFMEGYAACTGRVFRCLNDGESVTPWKVV